eukprot:COSAG02_NODE_817_length_16825_cov_49.127646_6_plen_89_part_00
MILKSGCRGGCDSLLPGLDMCNHVGGDGANASWVPADEGAVELRRVVQTRAQDKGDQAVGEVELTISYGDKTGRQLCLSCPSPAQVLQ